MTDLEYIVANLSEEDILCQISEEADELAKAALKLRRAITGTNPTPVSYEDAIYNLIEEYGDVVGAFRIYAKKSEIDTEVYELSNENIESKFYRQAQRIKEARSMNDTIRELINRVLDYVEKMPGAQFSISRWDEGIRGPGKSQMHFMFFYTKGDNPVHYISRDDDEYWSQLADLDEDNLRYLVEQLEDEMSIISGRIHEKNY